MNEFHLHIRPIVSPGEGGVNRQYEFYNQHTTPVRFKDGKILPSLEGADPQTIPKPWARVYIHETLPGEYMPEWKHELNNGTVRISLTGDTSLARLRRKPLSKPNIYFDLADPGNPGRDEPRIGLVVRTYTYDRLDIRREHGWYRIADTSFSYPEMLAGISKPSYSTPDLYYMSDPQRSSFRGYDAISVFRDSKPGNAATTHADLTLVSGHPVKRLLDVMEYNRRETDAIERITPTNASLQAAPRQSAYPPYYFAPSLPKVQGPIPPTLGKFVQYTKGCYSFTPESFFTHHPGVVPEAWFEARIREVLAIRGLTEEGFLALVERAKQNAVPNTDDFHQCIQVADHVIRMHTCSRPYVIDHTWVNGERVCSDQETYAFQLPGDCEDSACTVYNIHMELLSNTQWKSSLVQAARSCAAILGVPCCVCGTFLDPEKDEKDCPPNGHAFACAIPFITFARCVGGYDQKRNEEIVREAFGRMFGFELPVKHTKIGIVEAVFHTTIFYGDHRDVSQKKKNALYALRSWLKKKENDELWCWQHFHTVTPMDKARRGHGHAFRLFTDMLVHMPLLKTRTYDGKPIQHVCRSFLVLSNIPDEDGEGVDVNAVFNVLYPESYDVYAARVQENVRDQIKASMGKGKLGVSVEVFGSGRQTFRGEPLFLLRGILADPAPQDQHVVRRMYERPMVPLGPYPHDNLRLDPIKRLQLPNSTDSPVPPESNDRLTLYVYDLEEFDVESLRQAVGATQYKVLPYAFSYAVILYL